MSEPQAVEIPVAPEPEFQVLGATGRRHAAVPAIDFDVHVSEPGGRAVYAIALSAQIMIEPARRAYDAETREKLVELFGAPERWATTTRSLVWHQADVLVPAFTGSTTFRVAVPASFDMEVASTKYLYGLPDGEVPLGFNFNGTVHYRGDDGRLQMSLDPLVVLGRVPLPGGHLARADRALLPADRLGRRCRRARCGRSSARRPGARCPRSTRAWPSCSARRTREPRDARRLAALRGLRALPLHAGGDQERHAHAVRDRLPARLRADARQHLRPSRAAVRGRGRGGGERRGALPGSQRRAPPGRAAAAGGRGRVRRGRPVGADAARAEAARGRAAARVLPRREPHRGGGGPRPRRRHRAVADLDPPHRADRGWALHLPARGAAATASTPGRSSPRGATT